MSMNFGREQALLRQRLTEKGSPELAAEQQARFGDKMKCLGAADDEVLAAASDLVEQFPTMGRAQMTAFVRTLWGSKTHELRGVGVEILARRAELLEPPDLAFVEGLLKDGHDAHMQARLASDVLGALVCKNKKLWKDLQKLAKSADDKLRLAAVRAAKAPCANDGSVFDRFEKLVTPLLAEADEHLQAAVDEVLRAAAEQDAEAVKAFASEHGLTFDG
jgi:hypothetical protein